MNYDGNHTSTILLTGANGFLASHFIAGVLSKTSYALLLLCSSKEKVETVLSHISEDKRSRVTGMTNDAFFAADFTNVQIEFAIHMAFARRVRPACDIASSIVFTKNFYKKCCELNITHVINISSQGVYGNIQDFRREEMMAAPETIYSMAKYASEVLADAYFENRKDCIYTNLRVDLIMQSQNLVRTLCKKAIEEGKLQLVGGKQFFSYIDVSDVASAIVSLIQYKGKWKKFYNIGWNETRYTLIEIANRVAVEAKKYLNYEIKVYLDKQDVEAWTGMNSRSFMEDTGWAPQKDITEMIAVEVQKAYDAARKLNGEKNT